jgi:hypothetical protein
MCVPEQRVCLAQTFLTGGAASLWRAKSDVLQAQGFDIQDWDVFARTLEQAFGHQDPEQNAKDKLDVLKQTGLVKDYANRVQSLVAGIVAMPPSEGDLLQKFRNGLKPNIQMVASIDPVTGTRWMNCRSSSLLLVLLMLLGPRLARVSRLVTSQSRESPQAQGLCDVGRDSLLVC